MAYHKAKLIVSGVAMIVGVIIAMIDLDNITIENVLSTIAAIIGVVSAMFMMPPRDYNIRTPEPTKDEAPEDEAPEDEMNLDEIDDRPLWNDDDLVKPYSYYQERRKFF